MVLLPKKKKVLSFLGMVLSKSNTTQTDSFLRSPDGATLFARREILFFFLDNLEGKVLGQNNNTLSFSIL